VGSLNQRIEALERRLGGREPVRIVVVYEGGDEPLYSFTLRPSEDADHPLKDAPGQERDGDA
jgi:hypothetical protein